MLMVNDAGEFRAMFLDLEFVEERFPAMQARIFGRTRFIGARCPEGGALECFAHPITYNVNSGGRNFCGQKCVGCDQHRAKKAEAREAGLNARYDDLVDSCRRHGS